MSLSLQITQARSPGAVNRSVTFVDISSYINPGDVTRRYKARYRAASCFIALHAHRARVWSQGRLCEFPDRGNHHPLPPRARIIFLIESHTNLKWSIRWTKDRRIHDVWNDLGWFLKRHLKVIAVTYSLVHRKIFNTGYLNFVIFYRTFNISFSAFCILPIYTFYTRFPITYAFLFYTL